MNEVPTKVGFGIVLRGKYRGTPAPEVIYQRKIDLNKTNEKEDQPEGNLSDDRLNHCADKQSKENNGRRAPGRITKGSVQGQVQRKKGERAMDADTLRVKIDQ